MKRKKKTPHSLAVLIPTHNEALVIAHTLQSVLERVTPVDIYIVDDASTDNTVAIAKKYTKNILSLPTNVGKAGALNLAITHFALPTHYDYVLPLDADTMITPSFLLHAPKMLERDASVVAVVGKITARRANWISAYRSWEYELSQSIHKQAQSRLQGILVCSGCATLYRTSLFTQVAFPEGTVTEDMDLTFLIHRRNLGKISYCPSALVITQEPATIRDYVKQTLRWFTGFWQCVRKYDVPWGGQMLDLESVVLALDGLFSGLLLLSYTLFSPLLLLIAPRLILSAIVIDITFFMIPTVLITSFFQKHWRLSTMLPIMYVMRLLTSCVFFLSFFRTFLLTENTFQWNKVSRYKVTS